jgi:uncharacterized membrane protein YeaQ/YmgE (transglycosylase-associated protein family)
MEGVGWIMTIVIGALAGLIAEKVMKAEHGLLTNIVLGILGAVVLNLILEAIMGWEAVGWIANLLVGAIGACVLIWAYRAFRGRKV